MTSVPSKQGQAGHANQDASAVAKPPIARGQLVPLRTKAELQARDETVDVYVVEVPLKDTGKVLNVVKQIPGQSTFDLHHLRRVVKHGYEPGGLLEAKNSQASNPTKQTAAGALVTGDGGTSDISEGPAQTPSATTLTPPAYAVLGPPTTPAAAATATETVHILLSPTSLISPSDLLSRLHAALPNISRLPFTQTPVPITLPVPLHPPPTPSHAAAQSKHLWPAVYNPNTVYGPNPAVVAAAQAEIEPCAGRFLGLARHVGRLARESERGEGIGVVVVERVEEGEEGKDGESERAMAVAGDGRYTSHHDEAILADAKISGTCSANGAGERESRPANPANHAVMRAIEAVASKRRRQLHEQDRPDRSHTANSEPNSDIDLSRVPLSDPIDELAGIEHMYNAPHTTLKQHGYLCLNLEFYISHEPCLMCSMALVHSRVGRVVFGKRMPKTGGLTAETSYSVLETSDGRAGWEKKDEDRRGDGGIPGDREGKAKPGLGYGLFWREELNWRFLCWECGDDGFSVEAGEGMTGSGLHSNVHA